jgi:ribokinase
MRITRPNVIVIGSLNLDYIASVPRLPAPGQTIAATGLVRRFGGKGANQAVAAARQGARVSLIGCVGADAEGAAYRQRLRKEGIDTTGVSVNPKALTGTALIAVDQSAENMIVVAAGANGQLKPKAIREQQKRLVGAGILLLQLEVPLATVLAAIRIANASKVPVILNPSPLHDDFPWGDCQIDTLIVNAGEAAAIFGLEIAHLSAQISSWRRGLADRAIKRLIITRGAEPTICLEAETNFEVPTLKVEPIDTVGAGDAFAGTFAARRAEGLAVETAIAYANCAGALATRRAGAQEAMPNRAATERAFRCLSR